MQKPEVFLKSITFNDGTTLQLERNSIVVFTGANNCGKSQVLKDIEISLDQSNRLIPIVITNVEKEFKGDLREGDFFGRHFKVNSQGYYQILGTNTFVTNSETIISNWNNHVLINGVHSFFVKRLSTESRLTSSKALTNSEKYPETHPIYKLSKNEALAQKISSYFRQAFNADLVINLDPIATHLHVGKGPNKTEYNVKTLDKYFELVSKLPKLQEEGDGMRSFAGILLDTFTSEYNITLIDEPEAFLHPPQAKVLGKMLAKNNPTNRQLFIATHSEDFLQGLIDVNAENVTAIRINRDGNINRMSILHNNEIKKLWRDPILRYSNILSGLFHEKVVVCESDYDCLFYQALMDALPTKTEDVFQDILFVHCGGKARISNVVKALKAVNVPVIAICDFDILNEKPVFKSLTDSFGVDWDVALLPHMTTIYDIMNARNSKEQDTWERVKKNGKTEFSGKAPAEYEVVEKICKSAGLFVVPVGELESFDKTIDKQKKDWVYSVLKDYNLSKEKKLSAARDFITEIVNYEPILRDE